ncbi:hypothetical protein HQ576_14720 [bacterium]|nr:hypothetical protein [bacterium]
MYALLPLKVFALASVQDSPAAMVRVDRILAAIGRSRADLAWITEQNLPDVVAELQSLWPPADAPAGSTTPGGGIGARSPHAGPLSSREFAPAAGPLGTLRPLVFTMQELGDEKPDLSALLERCPEGTHGMVRHILGQFDCVRPHHSYDSDRERNMVCWPTQDFGTMTGCPHGCLYCGEGKGGKFIAVAANTEDFMEQVVGPTIEKYPGQQCFRMIGWGADHLAFEPENGVIDLFTRKLAEYPGRYGYFHTASANVDWIADLPHRDRLIGVWSVTCDTVARCIEQGAGPCVERFEAGRKCQAMGLPIRYKFKPIIPVRHWREEYAAAIETMLRVSKPESVGMCLFIWNTYESMCQKLPVDLLDPHFVAAARDSADEMAGDEMGPFPHALRAEVYRFFIQQIRRWDEEVPVYVSTESREMWVELKDEIGQDPRAYVCACSPVALPGRRLKLSPEIPHSTYFPPEG